MKYNKLYEKTTRVIKQNYKFLITYILILFLILFKLPFYIEATGGIVDVSKRIEIENAYKSKGSMNMTYVSEMRATIPLWIVSKFNSNWDIVKKEDLLYENETYEEMLERGRLTLKESMNNAITIASRAAGKEVTEADYKTVVIFKSKESKTDLKIGDQILKIDNKQIVRIDDVTVVNNYNVGNEITIEIQNNNKKEIKKATLIDVDGLPKIGVSLIESRTIKTDYKYKLNFKPSESGPSGGLMTTLSIYDLLTKEDITKGDIITGTGTIDLDGNVGAIGGVKYKLAAAVKAKAKVFLVPNGENYKTAINYKNKNNYKIEVVGVSTFEEALKYLQNR